MGIKIFQIFVILMVLTTCFDARAQEQSDKVKAIFLFKFMDYIRWDNITISKPIICTYPNRAFGGLLNEINHVQDDRYIIRNPVDKNNIRQCHILYLGDGIIPQKAASEPILTISDMPNFAKKNGMIELHETPTKIKLIVNIPQLKKMGLTPSSRLLDVAEIIR